MLIVALTGGMGSGKSTAARLMTERGATVIDVDALGRRVLARGGRAEASVAASFGPSVLATDGTIDAAALAKAVFSDGDALARLTSISHPAINKELLEELRSLPPSTQVVVLDIAILTESNLGQIEKPYQYSVVITVEADPVQREDRAVKRGSDHDDVRRRMSLQSDEQTRRAVADFVITNDSSMANLIQQVDQVWEALLSLA